MVLLMLCFRLGVGSSVDASLKHFTDRSARCRCKGAEMQRHVEGLSPNMYKLGGITVWPALQAQSTNRYN